MANETGPAVGISLGSIDKASIAELRGAVMDVLNAPGVDNATKVAALRVIRGAVSIRNASITNCNVMMGAANLPKPEPTP